jgi:hypothetical protein
MRKPTEKEWMLEMDTQKPTSWEEAMDELVDEKHLVEKALYELLKENVRLCNTLRDVIDCWEQGGTPMEIDAAMNRAAVTLKLGE